MTQYILRGGEVVDGSGSPRFRADVAISGDRIRLSAKDRHLDLWSPPTSRRGVRPPRRRPRSAGMPGSTSAKSCRPRLRLQLPAQVPVRRRTRLSEGVPERPRMRDHRHGPTLLLARCPAEPG